MTRRKAVDTATVNAEGLTVTVSVLSDGERPPIIQVTSPQRLVLEVMWAGQPWEAGNAKQRTSIRLTERKEEES